MTQGQLRLDPPRPRPGTLEQIADHYRRLHPYRYGGHRGYVAGVLLWAGRRAYWRGTRHEPTRFELPGCRRPRYEYDYLDHPVPQPATTVAAWISAARAATRPTLWPWPLPPLWCPAWIWPSFRDVDA